MSGRGQFTKALAIAVAGLLIASAAADAAPRDRGPVQPRGPDLGRRRARARHARAGRSVTVGGRDVTRASRSARTAASGADHRPRGRQERRDRPLRPTARGARITIDNHPIGGPCSAGPQVQPWICNTQNPPANSGTAPTVVPVGLGPPRDAQCNTPSADQLRLQERRHGRLPGLRPGQPARRLGRSRRRRPTRARRSRTSCGRSSACRTAASTRSRCSPTPGALEPQAADVLRRLDRAATTCSRSRRPCSTTWRSRAASWPPTRA